MRTRVSLGIYAVLGGCLLVSCTKKARSDPPADAARPATPSVTLTARAAESVRQVIRDEGLPMSSSLRASVTPEGPTGFSYGLVFDDQVRPGDVRTTSGGVNIVVDQESWPYLAGAVVDLDASGKGFRFDNPNMKRAVSDSPPARPASSERGRCLFAEQSSKYTVVFAASAERVQAIFVGWRQPGPLRTRVERNPFTGKDMTVRTTEPAKTDPGAAARAWDLRSNEISPDAGYAGYLESKIPPEIRGLPHRPMKRVLIEMMALAEALTGKDEIPDALYPPSGCTTALPLLRLPDPIVAALRALNDDRAAALAGRLAKHETFREWSMPDIRAFLGDLRSMLTASASGGLYLLPV
jgi:iron-sulfur cluster assembly protein